jgi:hypothetical protein
MFARYTVLNLPPLPPPPAPNMGCGGGETRCKSKKNKESPPWVCEKCAKKTGKEKRKRNLTPGVTSEATLDLGRDRHGIGCPEHDAASVEAEGETSEATLDLGRDGHSVGCMSRPPGAPDETSEASLDLGCDKCQKGKKRRQAAAAAFRNSMPSGWMNLQGPMLRQVPIANRLGMEYVYAAGGHGGKSVPYARNYQEETSESTLDLGHRGGMLGQVPLVLGDGTGGRSVPYKRSSEDWYEGDSPYPPMGAYVGSSRDKKQCSGAHRYMGQNYACPVSAAALDPTLNCQRDARGNAVCSNGVYFPPGCPHTPPEEYFSPGIAPDEVHNGILEAKVPPPRQAGTTGSSGIPAAGAPAGTPGTPVPVTATNIVPLAAGGIAIAGLLYAILR